MTTESVRYEVEIEHEEDDYQAGDLGQLLMEEGHDVKSVHRLDGGAPDSDEFPDEDPDAWPDSPVSVVKILHKDGTKKTLMGEDARSWASWVDGGVGLRVARGQVPPDVDWTVEEVDKP